LLLCSLVCSSADRQADHEFRISASFTQTDIVIDGDLGESAWRDAQEVTLRDNRTGENVEDEKIITTVKTCYDAENLYISFVCNDPDIWGNFQERDDHLWTEEAVEVFIDTDTEPTTYIEIEVSPQNVLFDSYIIQPQEIDVDETAKFELPGMKTAVTVDGTLNQREDVDRRWTVEIAIPFRDMVEDFQGIVPGETEWRINFYRINRDRDAARFGHAWSPTGTHFHNPGAFGYLVFEK
jgi:hypothetical protein